MTKPTSRAITIGLLASTVLATPALAQNVPPDTATQPQTTGQSPAPGTNATDVTTPPKYSEYLAAHIPHAALAWVGNAGHRAPLEQPASWNAAVTAWGAEHM